MADIINDMPDVARDVKDLVEMAVDSSADMMLNPDSLRDGGISGLVNGRTDQQIEEDFAEWKAANKELLATVA